MQLGWAQVQRLQEEREAAEASLQGLASQLDTARGAAAAEAGDMKDLKNFWQVRGPWLCLSPFSPLPPSAPPPARCNLPALTLARPPGDRSCLCETRTSSSQGLQNQGSRP